MINKIKTRRFVTLIEMLLVLVILSLVAGVIGINIAKAVVEQRFRSEVYLVADQIRLAQDLMLIADVDVNLLFVVKEKGIEYYLTTSKDLPGNWKQEIDRSHKYLTTIKAVEFDDQLKLPKISGSIDIKFYSKGGVMSSGALRLATAASGIDKDILEKFIILPGYPTPVSISNTEEVPSKESDISRDNALSNYIFREINGTE